jgi:hypothetical protein
MGPLRWAEVPVASAASDPSRRARAKTITAYRNERQCLCASFFWIFVSLLLIASTASVTWAQSAPAAEPGQPAPPGFPAPVPLIWGVPVEVFAGDTDPCYPLDCFAETFAGLHGSLQVVGGAYFCPVGMGPRSTPRFDFAPIDVRLGCILFSPWLDGCCLRGNIEALLELTTSTVLAGPGAIVTGPVALLRYDFVQPGCCLVPYLQGGGGFVYNDGYRDKTQRALGQAGEFYLQATGGLHFLLDPHWSFDIEGGYLHISNADTNARNGGINALGGSLGLTYFFGKAR